MSLDYREDLKQLDDAWEQAEVEEGPRFEDLPDGKYEAEITEVCFNNSKQSGRFQMSWEFTVRSPEKYRKRKIFRHSGLETQENIKWLKQDFATCGIYLQKLSDVDLAAFIGRVVEIQLKTKGEFQNVYINRLISVPGQDELGKTGTDDEVPF